jgi:hypothetical protein
MQSLGTRDLSSAGLPEVELRVAEINALIERQRELIEQLGQGGHDTTSPQIVFDSLCLSLCLYLQNRHQLRSMMNFKAA